MFESRRRFTGRLGPPTDPLPIAATIAAMDEGGVALGLTGAWYGLRDPLIDNEEAAGFVAQCPDRLRGVAGADLRKPM